jgi:hypothetical protein
VTADAAWSNLAPGAGVNVSSTDTNPAQDGLTASPSSLNDRLQQRQYVAQYWRSAPGQVTGQWVTLTFPVPVTVRTVRLYNPLPESGAGQGSIQMQGATVTLQGAAGNALATGTAGVLSTAGTDVAFADVPNVTTVRIDLGGVTGSFEGRSEDSLGEIEVIAHG